MSFSDRNYGSWCCATWKLNSIWHKQRGARRTISTGFLPRHQFDRAVQKDGVNQVQNIGQGTRQRAAVSWKCTSVWGSSRNAVRLWNDQSILSINIFFEMHRMSDAFIPLWVGRVFPQPILEQWCVTFKTSGQADAKCPQGIRLGLLTVNWGIC